MRIKRNEALINMIAQLIYSPHPTTANSIKNHLEVPRNMAMVDKPLMVALLKDGLNDESEMELPQ